MSARCKIFQAIVQLASRNRPSDYLRVEPEIYVILLPKLMALLCAILNKYSDRYLAEFPRIEVMLGQDLKAGQPSLTAKWARLEAHVPRQCPVRIGILLVETCEDRLFVRITPGWWQELVDREEAQVWQELSADITRKAENVGATTVVDWLEQCCSHALRIGAIQPIQISDPETCLNELYQEHIGGLKPGSMPSKKAISRMHVSATLSRSVKAVPTKPASRDWKSFKSLEQVALAASLLLGALLLGSSSDFRPHDKIKSVYTSVELPLVSEYHFSHTQLSLPASLTPSRHYSRRRRVHVTGRIVRPFFIAPRLARSKEVQIALAQPPLLPVHQAGAIESVPPHLLSEPEFPEYRPRHNKFVRVLAAIAIPIRFVVSR